MKTRSVEPFRFEPTLLGAVRGYRTMALLVALLTTAAAVGYTLVQPQLYRADATLSVPQPSLSDVQNSDQYLDSQVLLLQSELVSTQAVRIANAELGSDILVQDDFSGDDKALEITPPVGASPGSYGTSIITVSFTWPDPKVAQEGANALLRAFDDVRSATIGRE